MIKNIIQFAKNLAIVFFDSLLMALQLFSVKTSDKKQILVVRLDNIGDAVLWLGSAQYLCRIYPRKEYDITLACNQSCIELYEATKYFDKVIGINRRDFCRNLFYRYKVLKLINIYTYDSILNPTFSREFLYSDSIIRICRAKNKIAFFGDFSNIKKWEKAISNQWYTKLIPSKEGQVMELIRNTEFIKFLGYRNIHPQIIEWKWILEYKFNSIDGKYFIIFPGASIKYRMWPHERFADISTRINQLTGWTIVIAGGAGEEFIADSIIKNLSIHEVRCINLVGKTNLIELATIIKHAQLLIGNDTSAIHMAAAVRTPSVCILGGGHYGRFMPYDVGTEKNNFVMPRVVAKKMECFNCNWQCRYEFSDNGVWRCIEDIDAKDVWREINILLR